MLTQRELQRRIAGTPAPGEREAGERGWQVVAAAFAEREPAPRSRVPWRATLVVAAVVAVALAIASPPGRAVIDSLREALGVEHAEPALFALPAPGRLVAAGPGGAWIVSDDGSKRRLGDYTDASWSPFGRYVVAARRHELAALEPDGTVRWTLARPDVAFPRWGGTETDTRIAYLEGRRVRVVAGDGTGDRDLRVPDAARVAPAWQPARPGRDLLLAYADTSGRVHVLAPASRTAVFTTAPGPVPTKLAWSGDGRRLLALAPERLRVYDASGHELESSGAKLADAAFVPGGHEVVVVRPTATGTAVERLDSGRVLFRAAGDLSQVVPSPDGRRLLIAWPQADQWVFVRTAGGTPRAVANVADQLGGAFPTVGGWALSP